MAPRHAMEGAIAPCAPPGYATEFLSEISLPWPNCLTAVRGQLEGVVRLPLPLPAGAWRSAADKTLEAPEIRTHAKHLVTLD